MSEIYIPSERTQNNLAIFLKDHSSKEAYEKINNTTYVSYLDIKSQISSELDNIIQEGIKLLPLSKNSKGDDIINVLNIPYVSKGINKNETLGILKDFFNKTYSGVSFEYAINDVARTIDYPNIHYGKYIYANQVFEILDEALNNNFMEFRKDFRSLERRHNLLEMASLMGCASYDDKYRTKALFYRGIELELGECLDLSYNLFS